MLSIIVNTFRNIPLAKKCIGTIIESCKGKIEFEIIISDSQTTPEKKQELESIKKQYPEITSLQTNKENTGYPKSVNVGIRAANGDAMLVMNSDILVHNDAIPKLYNYIKEHSEIGIISPKLLNIDGSVMESAYRFHKWYTIIVRRTFLGKTQYGQKHIQQFLLRDWDHKSIRNVDWVQGSAMLLRKETIKKIGVMDENIFLYFEDVDWCRRSWESGKSVVYFPNAIMTHYHKQESKGKNAIFSMLGNKMTRVHIKSYLYYLKKYKNNRFPKSYKELTKNHDNNTAK